MKAATFVLVASAAFAARAGERTEISMSLGGGFAYELVGLNVDVRIGHVEPYVGFGLLSLARGFALGTRYFARDDGSGFFVALNGAAHFTHVIDDQANGGSFYWLTLTPGYRWASDRWFLQAALGGGVGYAFTTYPTPPSPTKNWVAVPDALLGVGVRF